MSGGLQGAHSWEPKTHYVARVTARSWQLGCHGYGVWRWGANRVVRHNGGDGSEPRWPSADELQLNQALGEGERERAQRSETFEVTLRAETRPFVSHPVDEAAFASLLLGACDGGPASPERPWGYDEVAPGATLYLVRDGVVGASARPPTDWLTHVRIFQGEDEYDSGAVAEPAFVVETSGGVGGSCSFASYTFTATP